jgi:hypothetical protein
VIHRITVLSGEETQSRLASSLNGARKTISWNRKSLLIYFAAVQKKLVRSTCRKSYFAALLLPVWLAACAGSGPKPDLSNTVRRSVECAPYARSITGMQLDGEAADWWDEADGHYKRSQQPSPGAALVFERSGRLPSGHVAVVARVLSDREILVDQANWWHGHVSQGDLVRDVSERNDWTLVRVWWRPTAALGVTEYQTYGFVGGR